VLTFLHIHATQIKLSGASAAPALRSKLNAAHAIISQQAETIAIQQMAIEMAHETKAATDAALVRAEDELEAAHLQWIECLQKLGIAHVNTSRDQFYRALFAIPCHGATHEAHEARYLIRVCYVKHEKFIIYQI